MKKFCYLIILSIIVVSCATQRSGTKPSKPKQRHTVEVKKGNVDVTWDALQASVKCHTQCVVDSIVIISVQPMFGIEMFRIEATPDTMLVVDKIHRTYAKSTYKELSDLLGAMFRYNQLQKMVNGDLLNNPEKSFYKEFKYKKHALSIRITAPEILKDLPMQIRNINLSSYKPTTISKLLSL